MLLSWTLLKPCSFFPPLINMKRVKELSAGGRVKRGERVFWANSHSVFSNIRKYKFHWGQRLKLWLDTSWENSLSKSHLVSFCEEEECHGGADNGECPQNLPRRLQSDLLSPAFATPPPFFFPPLFGHRPKRPLVITDWNVGFQQDFNGFIRKKKQHLWFFILYTQYTNPTINVLPSIHDQACPASMQLQLYTLQVCSCIHCWLHHQLPPPVTISCPYLQGLRPHYLGQQGTMMMKTGRCLIFYQLSQDRDRKSFPRDRKSFPSRPQNQRPQDSWGPGRLSRKKKWI